MADGLVSQWLSVGEYRSCFCMDHKQSHRQWLIEGRLPNGESVQLASYASELFVPGCPRYITMKAMCGLPIRFVAAKTTNEFATVGGFEELATTIADPHQGHELGLGSSNDPCVCGGQR